MQSLTTVLKTNQNKQFYRGLLTFVGAATLFLLFYAKSAAALSLNTYHPFWLNLFFINYTFMGDGIFAACLIVLLYFYFKQKKIAITLLYSFLISGFMVQILKNLIYAPRPKLFFESGQYLSFLGSDTHLGINNFPSGHTASAFAIATVVVLLMKNKKWQLPILGAAILVGYSRIYLAQHFLLDIIFGTLIGVVSGVLSVYLIKFNKGLIYSVKKMHRISSPVSNSPSSSVQPV